MNMFELLINADDFGLSEKTSRGIIDTMNNGIVNATTVMATSPCLDVCLKLLYGSAIEKSNIGIHFNLTHGKPLSTPASISSLVDKDGSFFNMQTLQYRSILGLLKIGDIRRELSAQLERLKSKIKIYHINSHHHVHILPKVRDVVAELATSNKINYVRSPLAKSLKNWRSFLVSQFKGAHPEFWTAKGIKTSNNFFGFRLGGKASLLNEWRQHIKNLSPGLTEIMVHPGFLDREINDPYQDGRVTELYVLKDEQLKKDIKNRAISFFILGK